MQTDKVVPAAFHFIWSCRRESETLIQQIQARLAVNAAASELHFVAASGSLGRLEFGPGSDADLIIVTTPGVCRDSCDFQFRNVWAQRAIHWVKLTKM